MLFCHFRFTKTLFSSIGRFSPTTDVQKVHFTSVFTLFFRTEKNAFWNYYQRTNAAPILASIVNFFFCICVRIDDNEATIRKQRELLRETCWKKAFQLTGVFSWQMRCRHSKNSRKFPLKFLLWRIRSLDRCAVDEVNNTQIPNSLCDIRPVKKPT